MSRARLLPAAGTAALLAACTPMQWVSASLGTPASATDVQECDRSAYYEAQRQAFFYGYPYGYGLAGPRYFLGRDGRLYYDPWSGFARSDTFFLERQLFDYCMRAKGYRLAPARPADRS